jgi:hypothetical protein
MTTGRVFPAGRPARTATRLSLAAGAVAAIVVPVADAFADEPPVSLEVRWVSEGFSAPEGVAAAPQGGYFISNVAGEGRAIDGVGWISLIEADGTVTEARWAEGLDAPKGMAVHDGVLYVADVTQVRRFDIATRNALAPLPAAGAGFLNDMTVWNGEVLVSDSAGARIYRLSDGEFSEWVADGTRLAGINGLLADGERLLVSTMESGSLLALDGGGGGWQEIASGMKNADGIGRLPDGYLVSSWPGQIHYVSETGDRWTLLDTREAEVLQNDLSVFGDLVIVPNWKPGTVTAWKVVR